MFYLAMTWLFLSSVVPPRAPAGLPVFLAAVAVRLLFVYSTCKGVLLKNAPFMVLLPVSLTSNIVAVGQIPLDISSLENPKWDFFGIIAQGVQDKRIGSSFRASRAAAAPFSACEPIDDAGSGIGWCLAGDCQLG